MMLYGIIGFVLVGIVFKIGEWLTEAGIFPDYPVNKEESSGPLNWLWNVVLIFNFFAIFYVLFYLGIFGYIKASTHWDNDISDQGKATAYWWMALSAGQYIFAKWGSSMQGRMAYDYQLKNGLHPTSKLYSSLAELESTRERVDKMSRDKKK